MSLEERLWELVAEAEGEHEGEMHQGAVARLTVAIWEILYVFGEREESNVEFLTKAAQKVGSDLAGRDGITDEEQEHLDALQQAMGDILGFDSDREALMLSVSREVKSQFELACLFLEKSPAESLDKMVQHTLATFGVKSARKNQS